MNARGIRLRMLMLALCFAGAPVPAASQSGASRGAAFESDRMVQGREAQLDFQDNPLVGELLAVSPDSLWLLTRGIAVTAVPLRSLDQVRVQLHGMGGSKALAWNAIGATATVLAMWHACTQVEDASCRGIAPVIGVSWAIVGGIFGFALARSSRRDLPASERALRGFVRFPQRLPPGFEAALERP